tara:strand:+ start:167 stop:1261 length:1095 start_codon:yes stop_codon:yes gene_type:complete
MANFSLNQASEKEVWSTKYLKEYVRESGLAPFMGTSERSLIRIKNDLLNRAGAIVHFPLIGSLTGSGVRGSATLKGNEEALPNYSAKVTTTFVRNAVNVQRSEQHKTEINIADAGRENLKDWSAETLRDDLLSEMVAIVLKGANNANGSAGEDSTISYADATATQRNSYITLNADRVMIGVDAANNTGTMATSLANVDATNDKMTAAFVSAARAKARKATGTKITPYKTEDGREYYVLFVDSDGFSDLALDADIKEANLHARPRGLDNPLFRDGTLWYRGVMIVEIPELSAFTIAGAGASGVDVHVAALCGANAVSVAYSQKPVFRIEDEDYGFEHGVAIEECRGQIKTTFNGKNYGIVNIYHA